MSSFPLPGGRISIFGHVVDTGPRAAYSLAMCRNITVLRGLEPPATSEEIEAAARQYVRKVSGVHHGTRASEAAFEEAVIAVAQATEMLLSRLPPRQRPPAHEPPLRRLNAPRQPDS